MCVPLSQHSKEGGLTMLEISISSDLEWSIRFRMEGIRVTEILVKDSTVAEKEIKQKMSLMLGLAMGKNFTNKTGREI